MAIAAAAPAAVPYLGPPPGLPPPGEGAAGDALRRVTLGTATGFIQNAVIATVIDTASDDTNGSLHSNIRHCIDAQADSAIHQATADTTRASGAAASRTPFTSGGQACIPAAGEQHVLNKHQRQRLQRRLNRQKGRRERAMAVSAKLHAQGFQDVPDLAPGVESDSCLSSHITMATYEQIPPEFKSFNDGLQVPFPNAFNSCAPQSLYTYFFQNAP